MKQNVICESCGASFEKEAKEINRSISLKRKQYCSRKCAGKEKYRNQFDISQYAGNRKDLHSPFREHIRRINSRRKETDITIEYLKEIWESQKGICIYSGIQLVLPKTRNKENKIVTASLDRIDSSKGYLKGNVQFISSVINYMKSTLSHEETLELCKIIAENYNKNIAK